MNADAKDQLFQFVESQILRVVTAQVGKSINSLDFPAIANDAILQYFTSNNIPATDIRAVLNTHIAKEVEDKLLAGKIKWGNFQISGDNISGGTYSKFASTGIVDQASDIALVIQDGRIVSEKDFIAKSLHAVGNTTVDGDLIINGDITGDLRFVQRAIDERLSTITSEMSAVVVKSLSAKNINWANYTMSADRLSGGKISKLLSTGVSDLATKLAVTITDDEVSFEPLVRAKNIAAKTLTIDDCITLSDDAAANLATAVKDRIDTTAYAADDVICFGGKEVLSNSTLGPSIMHSNLRTVGTLKELSVTGSVSLSEMLYTSMDKVGINTSNPDGVFTVAAAQAQITIDGNGKKGTITTGSGQSLVLGKSENIIVSADDTVVSGVNISSSSSVPTQSKPIGSICFNSAPSLGHPVGWVSLGTSWASFGHIR